MISQFQGRKITRISGSSKSFDKSKWSGSCLSDVKVKGKQLFLHLEKEDDAPGPSHADGAGEFTWLKCHFLMWGSVRVNEFNCKPSKKNIFPEPRLVFYFSRDEFVVFYGGSFGEVEHPPGNNEVDILSDKFDIPVAVERLLEDRPVCFILLSQAAFSGLGNIIKNEVLFETGVHPMQLGSTLSREKATEIVNFVVSFSKRWLEWKMEEKRSCKFGDWTKIYKKTKCPSDHPTIKSLFGPEGMERITYWCPECQPEPEETTSATAGTQHVPAINLQDIQDARDGRGESGDEHPLGISPSGPGEKSELQSAEMAHISCGEIKEETNATDSTLDRHGCTHTPGTVIKQEGANTTDPGQSTCVTSIDAPAEACGNGGDKVEQEMLAEDSFDFKTELDSPINSEEHAPASCPPTEGGSGDCRPFKKVKFEPDGTTCLPSPCRIPDIAASPAPREDDEDGSRVWMSLSDIRVLMKRSIRVAVRRMNMTEYEV